MVDFAWIAFKQPHNQGEFNESVDGRDTPERLTSLMDRTLRWGHVNLKVNGTNQLLLIDVDNIDQSKPIKAKVIPAFIKPQSDHVVADMRAVVLYWTVIVNPKKFTSPVTKALLCSGLP